MPPTNEIPDQSAINNVWGQSTIGQRTFLTMPSGQTCWAKVIGLEGVLKAGVMGEADSLTAFVGREHIRRVRGDKGKADREVIDPASLMKSPETLEKIVKMVDGLIPYVVIEPTVLCHYRVVNPGKPNEDTVMIQPEERQPGGIYTDMIRLEDKMFLFNFTLDAVASAETFREKSASALGNLDDGQDVPGETQRPDGNRAERRKRPRRR
jgi:hypothetical protein